ncbi:acyl-CoA dehydrogenase domain-containing protein [Diplocarpon mali]|nr:acyl-CoA dehydrogenase domain-containing protein [Diplocarpon mali]
MDIVPQERKAHGTNPTKHHQFTRPVLYRITSITRFSDPAPSQEPFAAAILEAGLVKRLVPIALGGTADAFVEAALLVEQFYGRQIPLAEVILDPISCRLLVATNKPGSYQVLKHIDSSGFSSTGGPHIKFTDFRVPGENLLATLGAAGTIVSRAFTSLAAFLSAMAIGIISAAFEAALAQSVSDLPMDVKMRKDAVGAMTWSAASTLDSGKGGELAFETKIYCSALAVKAVVDEPPAVGVSSYGGEFPSQSFWTARSAYL